MLVTTCPECETTFRITEEILRKAGGQVRCGRCAHIFDAKTALRKHAGTATQRIAASRPETGTETPSETRTTTDDTESGVSPDPGWVLQDAPPTAAEGEEAAKTEQAAAPAIEPDEQPEPVPQPASETRYPAEADVELETAAAGVSESATEPEESAPEPVDEPIDTAAAAILASAHEVPGPDWLPATRETEERRRWPWTVGVVLLTLTLAGQLVHVFRADLASVPTIGPALIGVYARFGFELAPRVDFGQYDMLDLTGAAEPVTDQKGSLVIATRVQNKGPKVQPFPHIFVRLLDRWQDTIAGRYFSPAEYLVSPVNDTSRMSIGRTVDARFVIVDPGPSATGFELEFCMPAMDGYRCESDEARN